MPAQGNQSGWSSNDDNLLLSLILIVLGSIALGCFGWWRFHAVISSWVAVLALGEIGLIDHFTPALDPLARTIRLGDPRGVTLAELYAVLTVIGRVLRIPAILVILLLAALCFTRAAPSQFTRALDLDGLIREQALSFRSLAAFARRNLRLVPLDHERLRPSDPALHAHEWVTRFALAPDGSLDAAAARRGFVRQLGPLWRGVEAAPDRFRFFYAVFALHLDQQREVAINLLGSLAEALPAGGKKETAGPDEAYAMPTDLVAHADTLLRSTDLRARADRIAARHAYAVPALMNLLVEARRRSGVLAPAQFACLKLIDRNLWYALHSLGFEGDGPGQSTHPNPRVEAAGARDHWAAERVARRPLTMPSVDNAVDAVRAAAAHYPASPLNPEVS